MQTFNPIVFSFSIFLVLAFLFCNNFTLYGQDVTKKNDWHQFSETNDFDELLLNGIWPIDQDTLFNTYILPKSLGTNYSVQTIILQRVQYFYTKYKQNQISKKQFLNRFIDWRIDTTKLVNIELKNYIPILVFTDSIHKYVILDRNYNHDFTDDSTYVFKKNEVASVQQNDWLKYTIQIADHFEYAYNGHVDTVAVKLLIMPFKPSSLSFAKENELYYQYSMPNRVFKLKLGDDLTFYLQKNIPDTSFFNLRIRDESGRMRDKIYEVKDIFSFKDKAYQIDSLDLINNKIKVVQKDEKVIYGREKGMYFNNDISGFNQFNKPISTNGYKGKYVLIDFWATWCVPCIASIPILTELNKKYKNNNFSILSISVDKVEDTQKVKNYLAKEGMIWDVMLPNILKGNKHDFTKGGIPLFVLLDPLGKILEISEGLKELKNMDNKLKEVLNYK